MNYVILVKSEREGEQGEREKGSSRVTLVYFSPKIHKVCEAGRDLRPGVDGGGGQESEGPGGEHFVCSRAQLMTTLNVESA